MKTMRNTPTGPVVLAVEKPVFAQPRASWADATPSDWQEPSRRTVEQELRMRRATCNAAGGIGAEPLVDARKYWDRCLETQCPPMDEIDRRKK